MIKNAVSSLVSSVDYSGGHQYENDGGGVGAVNGNTLHYVYPGGSGGIFLTYGAVSLFAPPQNLASSNNLTCVNLGLLMASMKTLTIGKYTVSLTFRSTSAPSIVVIDGYSYVAWVDTGTVTKTGGTPVTGKQVVVVRFNEDLSDWELSVPIWVKGPEGSVTGVPITSDSSICLSIPPSGGRIALQFLSSTSGKSTMCYNLLYNPGQFMNGSAWVNVPNIENRAIQISLNDSNGYLANNYKLISTAWMSQGTTVDPTTGQDDRYLLQVLACYNTNNKSQYSFAWRIDGDGLPIDRSPTPVSGIGATYPGLTSNSLSRGIWLGQNAAGVIEAIWCQYNGSNAAIQSSQFRPSTDGSPGLKSPSWSAPQVFQNSTNGLIFSGERPSGVYVGLPVSRGPSPCPLATPTTDGATKIYQDCLLQEQVLVLFNCDNNGYIQCSSHLYGTSVVVPNYSTAEPADPDKLLLSTVADTFPYPIPDPSVWDNSSPSGTANWQACAYQYLVSNGAQSTVETTFNFGAGIKAGVNTEKGVGPVSDFELAAGVESATSMLTGVTNSTVLNVATKAEGNVEGADSFLLSPEGALFGRTYPTLVQAIGLFVPQGSTAPVVSMPAVGYLTGLLRFVAAAPPPSMSGEFRSYCYTPGNLNSYVESEINDRMYDLYTNLIASDPDAAQDFIIDGVDFGVCYLSRNYVHDISLRLGCHAFGGIAMTSYLEFSFSNTGNQRSEFQSTAAFKQAGRAYFDSSLYVGVGAGEGLEVFGFGEEVSGYATAGVSIDASIGASTESHSDWGVSLVDYLNPLAEGEAYSVRMYFLNPSRLWAAELKHFGFSGALPNIDFKNSAPTRILFTVPYISEALQQRMSQLYASA